MLNWGLSQFDGVAESDAVSGAGVDYDIEHRYAEHDYGAPIEETPALREEVVFVLTAFFPPYHRYSPCDAATNSERIHDRDGRSRG